MPLFPSRTGSDGKGAPSLIALADHGTTIAKPVFFSTVWFPTMVVRLPVWVLPNSEDYVARQFPVSQAARPQL
jgi:hypothetical protein